MSEPNDAGILKRIAQARRRIFLRSILNRLAWCWAGALGVSMAWFLVAPLFGPDSLRWWVLGATLGCATVAAAAWAFAAMPDVPRVALEIDRRFVLRERVSSALSLSTAERSTPAGRALMADANSRADGLSIGSRFSWLPGRGVGAVPVMAVGLLLIALFYEPKVIGESSADEKSAAELAQVSEEEQAKKAAEDRPKEKERVPDSEELKDLEDELRDLLDEAEMPDSNEDAAREKVRKADELQDQLEDFAEQEAKKFEALRERLDELAKKNEDDPLQGGPAEDFNDALARRDLEKAKEEMDRLQKKVKENDLSKAESEQLQKQLAEMKDRLERLTRREDEVKNLEELLKQAKSEGKDSEGLEREMKDLKEAMANAKALEELAKMMGEAQLALSEEDLKKAAEAMEKLGEQMGQMSGELQDLKAAAEALRKLEGARAAMAKMAQMGQGPPGPGSDGLAGAGKGEGQGDGQGEGGQGGGSNPGGDDELASKDARANPEYDPWGHQSIGGTARGGTFTKKSAVEMSGEIRRAAQVAPESVEVRTLPREVRDLMREYYENMARQK